MASRKSKSVRGLDHSLCLLWGSGPSVDYTMQRVTVGFGEGLRELVIPDAWSAFVIDGRIYVRADDGGFDFVKRVEAKVSMKTGRKSDSMGNVEGVSAPTTPTTTEVP